MALIFLISLIIPVLAPGVLETSEARSGKTTICHRTHSVTNPYRRITVSNSSLNSGHKKHAGGVWTIASVQGNTWGDIIPDATAGGENTTELNFQSNAAGQAIWRGQTINPAGGTAVCKEMTIKAFYDSEKAAGQSDSAIVAEMQDAQADEDLLLLKTLNLTFATLSTSNLDTAVSASEEIIISTNTPTSVSATGATLNGSVKTNATILTCHFEYATNAGFNPSTLNPTTAEAVATNATTPLTVTLTLTSSTKYYYRLVCHDSAANDLYGDSVSFTTGATYAVTYDSNTAVSGTVPLDYTLYSSSESAYIRGNLGSLTKAGYSFSGWTELANGSGTVYSPSDVTTISMSQNRTLYAKWNANTYSVTFDINSGTSGTMSTQSFTAGSPISLTTVAFSKTGYTFAGWATSSGGSVVYANSESVTLYAATTLYAKWTAITYTITYDSNTATSGAVPAAGSYTAGGTPYSVVGNTGSLVLSGYTFAGWNSTSASNGITYTSYSENADITLYAVWNNNATYRVDYLGNGNNGGSPPSPQIVTIGDSVTVATQSDTLFVKTGYTFLGWYSNSSGTSGISYIAGVDSMTPTANTILYANWNAENFPVNFDSNTATSGSMAAQTFTAGASQALSPFTFAKAGYSFSGWSTTSGGSVLYADSATVTLFETTTVYAKWEPDNLIVRFFANNGTGSTVNQSIVAGSSTALSANPFTYVGYSFNGWATSSGGSAVYANEQAVTIVETLDLYAQWTENAATTYSITYTAGGGSGTVPTQSALASGATFTTGSGSGLSRTRYTFSGWSCNSGSTVGVGVSVTMTAASMICVAQWTANSSSGGSGSGGGTVTETAPGKSGSTPAAAKKSALVQLVTIGTTPVKSTNIVVVEATTTPGKSGSTPATDEPTVTPGKSGSTPATDEPTATPGKSGSKISLSETTEIPTNGVREISFNGLGIAKVAVVNNEVSIQAKPGFSGKTTVKITLLNDEEISTILAEITVLPTAVTKPIVKVLIGEKTRIQWVRSPNAVSYEVTQNGEVLCATARTSCTILEVVSAELPVQLKSLGKDSTESNLVQATFAAAPKALVIPEVVLVINFGTAKYNVDAGDKALIEAFAAEVVLYGYTKIDISGHTDSRGGIDNNVLSVNRAKAARAYLLKLLPALKVTINGYADAINVASNTTVAGLAANRRAEFRVVS